MAHYYLESHYIVNFLFINNTVVWCKVTFKISIGGHKCIGAVILHDANLRPSHCPVASKLLACISIPNTYYFDKKIAVLQMLGSKLRLASLFLMYSCIFIHLNVCVISCC